MNELLKAEILKSAKELIKEGKDIRHIAVKSIAKKLGMTTPTLYNYFKNKEEMIVLAVELIADELIDTFRTPMPSSLTADMKLQLRIIALMDYFYKNTTSLSLIFSDSGLAYWGSGNIPLSEKVKEFKELLKKAVEEWLESEHIELNTEKITFILIGMMIGTIRYLKTSNKKNNDIAKESEKVFSYLKKGIREFPHKQK